MSEKKEKTIKELCREWKEQGLSYKKRYKRLRLQLEVLEEINQAYENASEAYGCDGDPMKLAGALWYESLQFEDEEE